MKEESDSKTLNRRSIYVSFAVSSFDQRQNSFSSFLISPEGKVYSPPSFKFVLPDPEMGDMFGLGKETSVPKVSEFHFFEEVKTLTKMELFEIHSTIMSSDFYYESDGAKTSQGRDFGSFTLCLFDDSKTNYWMGEAPDELFDVIQEIIAFCVKGEINGK